MGLLKVNYNSVFHSVTVAEGAEIFYTLDNNAVRTETVEEARVVDSLTRTAWLGHPCTHVFDNLLDFEGKMRRLVDTESKLVSLPSKLNQELTWYLLSAKPQLSDIPAQVKYHVFDVEKFYIYKERTP